MTYTGLAAIHRSTQQKRVSTHIQQLGIIDTLGWSIACTNIFPVCAFKILSKMTEICTHKTF